MMEGFERCLAERAGYNADIQADISAETIIDSYPNFVENYDVVDLQSLLLAEPHNPEALVEWTAGFDLMSGSRTFVPTNSVYHPYEPPGRCSKLFRSNTNGLAAGNTIEEAILHGLLEVIERDALSITEFVRNPGKELVLTPEDGVNYELLKKFTDAGVDVKLWLLPHDTGITTVVAATDDVRLKDAALLVMGAGSHLMPEIAVRRALTEAAQSRVVQIHGAREDTNREEFVRTIGYDRMKRMNGFWYEAGETVSMSELEDLSKDTPSGSIDVVLDRLKGIADNAVVVDLSREGVDVPVVRVVIPSFEMYTLDRERMGARLKSGERKKLSAKERPWRRMRRR
jgi:ribosomal protein S12 methylthiotransferase accessory factor